MAVRISTCDFLECGNGFVVFYFLILNRSMFRQAISSGGEAWISFRDFFMKSTVCSRRIARSSFEIEMFTVYMSSVSERSSLAVIARWRQLAWCFGRCGEVDSK